MKFPPRGKSPVGSVYRTFLFFTPVRKGITIAIDGYSSCGKSTLASDLAAALHYVHVDSGAMYRAVTLYLIEHGIPVSDPELVAGTLTDIAISFRYENTHQITLLNGNNVEQRIRDRDVNDLVSPVAAIPAVRRYLVAQQQGLGKDGGIVMDGRDIGTVVFPDADLKIFLTASLPVRVERRYQEILSHGHTTTRDEVAAGIAKRDRIDTTREDSPLIQADDAIVIDNTALTREEQLARALKLAEEAIAGSSKSAQLP